MSRNPKIIARNLLSRFGIGLVRLSRLQTLEAREPAGRDLELLQQMPVHVGAEAFRWLRESRSQLRQDIFALSEVGFKRGGFFVEFGAADGLYLSNSYLMESEFGWRGIVAEPGRGWHEALRRNRACNIETDCVWSRSGETLKFNDAQLGEFSTIQTFSDSDHHREFRKHGSTYDVKTISLNDLLDKYDAPETVDYLSIDTEGSEYDILAAFDFARRRFSVITVEHNFTPARDKMYALLTAAGYTRKLEAISLWDDWYVLGR